MLGRSYEDWAEFEEAERWFRTGIDRGVQCGVPWAPYAFEARWQLAWVLLTQGDWDGRARALRRARTRRRRRSRGRCWRACG